jgi:hypothetical protein
MDYSLFNPNQTIKKNCCAKMLIYFLSHCITGPITPQGSSFRPIDELTTTFCLINNFLYKLFRQGHSEFCLGNGVI